MTIAFEATFGQNVLMAKGHSYLWRKPGRRDEERRRFSALMRKLEATRIRHGLSKTQLVGELERTTDALRNWMTGSTVGRAATVAKIKDSLKRGSN